MAVALPLSNPVMLVVIVMAGVVVAVATVPANPFAETTEAEVTVPDAPAVEANSVTKPVLLFL
jgi:ABC-type transporter Mla subunit MlaD